MTATHSPNHETSTAAEVAEVFRTRQREFEAGLRDQGYTPDRIEYLSGRKFGPIAARLALRGIDVNELLGPEHPPVEEPRTGLARWARRQYEQYGSDDVRKRAANDRD